MGRSDRDLPETASASTNVGEAPPEPRALETEEVAPEIGPGDCLGRYTIRGLIGAGGMGRVFAAVDPQLGRTVAIKLIRSERTPPPRARARLLREAQALARLHHPNVVTVYDVGTQGEQVFIAMEHIEGATLAEWLAAAPRNWRDVLATFLAAGRGLAAAHAEGIVHRDFKPANVMVGENRVVVVDFGLARAGQDELDEAEPAQPSQVLEVSLTLTGEQVGTPLYMAPEQRAGGAISPPADQFSFCVALWEALHGVRPPSATRRPEVPGWVNAALERGLAAAPEHRFSSMDALLAALERDPARRRRRILAAAATAVAFGSVVTWGLHARTNPCAGAPALLAGVWDAPRKEAVRQAFAATKLPYAEDTWRRVSARIDEYAGGWAKMQTEACRATRVEGRQSDTLMDLRMSCLERHRAVLVALTDLWSRGMEAKSLEAAQDSARNLPALAECADARALTERTPLPSDSATVARITTTRAHLDAVVALNLAHRWAEAGKAAANVRAEAEATGWPQVRAETAFAEGVALYELRDPRAEPVLLDASRLAGEAHDDRLAARALTELVEDLSLNEETAGRALMGADIAESWIARAGNQPDLRAQLLHNRGETLLGEGKYDEGGAALRAAAPLYAAAFGDSDAETLANAGQLIRVYEGKGEYAAGIKFGEENLAATVRALGEEHPYVGVIVNNIAVQMAYAGDFAGAAEYYRRALKIDEAVAGPDSERAADTLGNLAGAELMLGRLDEAQAMLERADVVHRRILGPEHHLLAEHSVDLAAAWRKHGRYDDAMNALEHSLAVLTKTYGTESDQIQPVIDGMGEVLYAQGDASGALRHFQRSLDVATKTLGATHVVTLIATSQAAKALAQRRRCADARPLLAAAAQGLERVEHPFVAVALRSAAECDLLDSKPATALTRTERAIGILERARWAPVEIGAVRWRQARALWSLGRHADAVAAARQAERELSGDADGARDRAAARAWLASHD